MDIEKFENAYGIIRKIDIIEHDFKEINNLIREIESGIETAKDYDDSYCVILITESARGYNIDANSIIGALKQYHKSMLRELDELRNTFASL